jgi:multidrug efflux system membrane fusion protein
MSMQPSHHHPPTKLMYALASIAALILLLVWMQGGFTSKAPPGTTKATEAGEPVRGQTVQVIAKDVDDIMAWPGTVTARTVAQVAPKVTARIVQMTVRAGDAVRSGQIVAKLDERELQSRLLQARSAHNAAQAEANRSGAEARRVQNLFDQEAATQQSLETAWAAARTASARVAETRAAIGEAESLFAETSLRAPFDGVVVKRNLEPGDMALAGSPVLTLQSAQRLRVEAAIPERCARAIQKGQTLTTRIGTQEYPAVVEEIAPAADPKTRTVLVKTGLDPRTDAQPGAFARIEQSCGRHRALLAPAAGVRRSGQLESVYRVEEGRAVLRLIRTGKSHDGWVEVLSGLEEGDTVLLGDQP